MVAKLEDLVLVKIAAKRIHKSPKYVRGLISAGKLGFYRTGRSEKSTRVKVDPDEVERVAINDMRRKLSQRQTKQSKPARRKRGEVKLDPLIDHLKRKYGRQISNQASPAGMKKRSAPCLGELT